MPDSRTLVFESYRLDLSREQLWRGEDVIELTNKAFAVLHYLVEHAEQLITRDALLEAVWPGTFVSDASLTVCIHELRQALGETAQTPRFIETARGRGYRFLATVTESVPIPTQHGALPASSHQSAGLVGREAELLQLHQSFVTALQGERQVVLITGEAGIGKTALVETYIAQIALDETMWIGYGQCIDQHGAGEAYLPLLEALGRLCRGSEGQTLVDLLRQEAPSWLLQMPAFLSSDEFDALERRGSGATQERMLRELAEVLERLTAERPFVLVLEDLHWSDRSTLDWLAYIARRRDPARLFLLATYRPVEAIVGAHPLRAIIQELQRHGQCSQLLLDYLTTSGVMTYLGNRFGGMSLPDRLAQVIHQRTNGNPLFMITAVDDMIQRGLIQKGLETWEWRGGIEPVEVGVPESLRQLIEQQLAQLSSEELDILEAASVVGMEFAVAVVAAAIEQLEDTIEAHCATLTRREQFIEARDPAEWPDGTVTAQHRFIHALYQEVLYERVSVGRRGRLHHRIGSRLEAGYGSQAVDMAAELAAHFVRGRDTSRAVIYLQRAGENAWQRHAPEEAITHFTNALESLTTLPDTPARTQRELHIQLALGEALVVSKGYAAPEVERAYARARVLGQQVQDPVQLFRVLSGLRTFYFTRCELQTAHELGEQLLTLSQHDPTPTRSLSAHTGLGLPLWALGAFTSARTHLQQAVTRADSLPDCLHAPTDPGVVCRDYLSWVLWVLGFSDQALTRLHDTLTRVEGPAHPHIRAHTLAGAAVLYHFRREWPAVHERAEATMAVATTQGLPFWLSVGTTLHGWALAAQGQGEAGLAQMRQGLASWQATGATVHRTLFLALLAEAYGQTGAVDMSLTVLADALRHVHTTGERFYEAELYRLKGEFLQREPDRGQPATSTPETCFLRALDIARGQEAKAWELRAAMSLSHLWWRQGKGQEAYDLLAPVYEWFTEGFDTADLQEAKGLLDELSAEIGSPTA